MSSFEHHQKILVVGPAWVGDMVMAQALFICLKQRDQNTSIDVVAPRATLPLVARMPQVDAGLLQDINHGELRLSDRYRIGKSLRMECYEQAIVLPNSFKSALLPWFARIPQRTGWRGEFRFGLLNDLRYLDEEKLPLMVQRFCALAQNDNAPGKVTSPQPELVVDRDNLNRLLTTLNLNTARPVVGLCPGAEYGAAKQWPAKYYAAVADHYISNNGQVWIFGSQQDSEMAGGIVDAVARENRSACIDLTGKTSLVDAVDLIAQTACVVTNDSGLMHVSAALRRPLVVIYGSSSPGFTPPLSDVAKIMSLHLDCSPCFRRECPLGHTDCLHKLYPEQVIEVMDELVARQN